MPDPFGDLTFVDGTNLLPFSIERAYFITQIPGDAKRGGHCHKKTNELLIAISGAFTVHLESPLGERREFRLNNSRIGLVVPALHWRDIDQYEPNSICLVLASEHYAETDYIRDYQLFRQQNSSREKK